MGTPRQKKLAKVIVENATLDKPLNKKEMLENVGYSESTAEAKATDIIESEGVQEELIILGFTEENAKRVVQEIMLDIEADKSSRLKAADMVFKVQGTYAPEKKDVTSKGEKLQDTRLDILIEQLENELDAQGTTESA